jgi:rhodanese-related sulfurtransferase
MKLLSIGIIIIILGISACNQPKNKSVIPEISSIEGEKLLSNPNYYFLDVRTITEHEAIRIPNTNVIPVQELASRLNEIEKYKEKKIVVYCRSGNRSSKGTKILNKYGFEAMNLVGGMLQWKGPVEKK